MICNKKKGGCGEDKDLSEFRVRYCANEYSKGMKRSKICKSCEKIRDERVSARMTEARRVKKVMCESCNYWLTQPLI